jgi:hypothetical protein
MMHFTTVTLALLLAHVLGDFVLQRTAVVNNKADRPVAAYAEHGLVHLFLMVGALAAFTTAPVIRFSTLVALVVLTIVHIALDITKQHLTTDGRGSPAWLFAWDQVLHVVTVAAVAAYLAPPSLRDLQTSWAWASDTVLVVTLGYTVVVFGAGYFNGVLLRPLSTPIETREGTEPGQPVGMPGGLQRAGLLIGFFERFLIMTAVLVNSPAGVGLVIAAKSVFRFGEARSDRRAAEYFLIGTFVSVTEAVIGGVLVLWLLRIM